MKTATRKALTDLGLHSSHARALAADRTIAQVEQLTVGQIVAILGITDEVAEELWSLIHRRVHPIRIKQSFLHGLSKLIQAVDDVVHNATDDAMRMDLSTFISKHTDGSLPSFSGSYSSDHEANHAALHLFGVESNLGPAVLASLEYYIDGTTIVFTGIDLHMTDLAAVAQEMSDAGYLSSEETQIISDHPELLPAKSSPIQKGDRVACSNQSLKPRKSSAFRSKSCSGRSSNPSDDYRWPRRLHDKHGTVTYSWRFDGLFDVTFDCGTRVKIHRNHMIKVLSSSRIDEMGWPY